MQTRHELLKSHDMSFRDIRAAIGQRKHTECGCSDCETGAAPDFAPWQRNAMKRQLNQQTPPQRDRFNEIGSGVEPDLTVSMMSRGPRPDPGDAVGDTSAQVGAGDSFGEPDLQLRIEMDDPEWR